MSIRNYYLFALLIFVIACNSETTEPMSEEVNPAAEGFNLQASDEKAIALADSVMAAMGGRKNWDDTRYIRWNFFGARTLLWDKLEQKARVESHRDSSIYIVDLKNGGGMVMRGGEEYTAPDSIAKYTERAEGMWINDSYWLVMPYKLKDSGVTLKYVGQDTTQAGEMAEVLQLTFDGVGNTPNNKYMVYVDPATHLVSQWAFFTNADDPEPRFYSPWADYKKYGTIMLSGNRGQRAITDIAIYEQVPEGAFTSLEPLEIGD